jgi:RND family efflux transporter MFP subunit
MNNSGAIRPLLTTAAILGLAVLSGCSQPGQTAEEAFTRVTNVETRQVVPQTFTATIRVTASVEAFYDVNVVSEEGGVVERLLPAKGARVRQGEVLALLNAEVLQAQLEEARAAADLAEDQWQRRKRLWEDQQIGSEQEYVQARETSRMRAATVSILETRLRKKTIRSPVAGTFEHHHYEVGEYAAPGTPFARVISTSRMKVTGGVPERYSTEIRAGTPVEILLDPYPDRTFAGRIDFVGDAVDEDSRTIPVEVQLDNPGGLMKAGMIASLLIVRSQFKDALVVPQEAVLRTEDGYQVFVVVQEDSLTVARSRMVELGPSQDDRVVIISGLKPGEQVVTVGQLKLGNGDVLNVVGSRGGSDNDGDDGNDGGEDQTA